MTDDWFDQPDMQAAALEALDANPVARAYHDYRPQDVQSIVERVLGPRLRQAINDPSRHVMRRPNERFGDRATRAAIHAIVMGLFENDLHLITGERLTKLEHTARQVQPSPLREDPAALTAEEFEDFKHRWRAAHGQASSTDGSTPA